MPAGVETNSYSCRSAHALLRRWPRDTAKRFIKVSARDAYRAEAKSLTFEQRRELIRGQFSVRESLGSVDVLIVDDVFRSGLSMSEVARAAREAGARSIYGLAAVRTMRR